MKTSMLGTVIKNSIDKSQIFSHPMVSLGTSNHLFVKDDKKND